MHPAAAIRFSEHRFQEVLAEVTRDRQAIHAERAQNLESGTRRYSFTSLVAAVVAFLATAGSLAGGR
jgi:hypothetical protein